MAPKDLDIVIFGATGYTGVHAVEHMARARKQFAGLSWGVAGRSKQKLEEVMSNVAKKTEKDLSSVPVIVADVSDEASLRAMCSRARVVANCCGPYRLWGEPVVRAAVHCGAHYVDVSGEPQFIETMQVRYDEAARAAGVFVVSACGLDSVPNDLGVVFLQQNFQGTLNSVESWLSTKIPEQFRAEVVRSGGINYGTWESLVHGVSHYDELKPLRKQLYPERLPAFKPKLQPRSPIHRHNRGWCIPFPGSDGSVVYRSQRHFYHTDQTRPVQFKPYLKFPSLVYVLVLYVFAAVLFLMSKTAFTRQLLLDHPRLFTAGFVTKKGPKREVMESTRFTVELEGRGWAPGEDTAAPPTKTLAAKVQALDPGYGFTTLSLLLCAVTTLRERTSMPTGGVLTTGAAFSKTTLIKQLQDNGVVFEVYEKK